MRHSTKPDRDFYVRAGAKPVNSARIDATKAMCYLYTQVDGRIAVIYFLGKQSYPIQVYTYTCTEAALIATDKYYKRVAENLAARDESKKATAKAKAAAKDEFEGVVGSIFVSSWGYEQTNVDAYQIVARVDRQTVEVVKIGLESTNEDNGYSSMADNVRPIPQSTEEAATLPLIRARITAKTSVHLSGRSGRHSGDYADLWDGERSYYRSWYA